jgi:hypothetical protein
MRAALSLFTPSLTPTAILFELPLRLEMLNGLVKVVFISRRRSSRDEITALPTFVVRREKVLRALLWLIKNNREYEGVKLDMELLGRLPEEGILQEVYDKITYSNEVNTDSKSHSRYDMPDLLDDDTDEEYEGFESLLLSNVVEQEEGDKGSRGQ